MKLLSIFILIIAIILFTAGLWLWGFLACCVAWWVSDVDTYLLRKKLKAIRLIIRSHRFIVGVIYDDTSETCGVAGEVDMHIYTELFNEARQMSVNVDDIQQMINKPLRNHSYAK